MIVRTLAEIINTDRDVRAPTFHSRRLLLAKDGLDFSLNDTILKAGSEIFNWYQNHIEAVYCVDGEGEVESVESGKVYPISDGSFYALNDHDKHIVRAKTDLRLICVFSPPLVGQETHDADGGYPLLTEEP